MHLKYLTIPEGSLGEPNADYSVKYVVLMWLFVFSYHPVWPKGAIQNVPQDLTKPSGIWTVILDYESD